MVNEILLIFVKNPVKGTVKTRLAKTIGDEGALKIYEALLRRTRAVANEIENIDKAIFYSDIIEDDDLFDKHDYQKFAQTGNDLGERMYDAFKQSFSNRYFRVVLIGSDCYTITPEIIQQAFRALREKDVVIGPAEDGGYYLIGMRRLIPKFFRDKAWSTSDVFLDTLLDVKEEGYSYEILPTLSDIDREEDLPKELRKLLDEDS